MIRYADVLLLLAECQIETGDLPGALANINLVRARAANPAGFVKEADGVTNAANYQISTYPFFPGSGLCPESTLYGKKAGTRSGRSQMV